MKMDRIQERFIRSNQFKILLQKEVKFTKKTKEIEIQILMRANYVVLGTEV